MRTNLSIQYYKLDVRDSGYIIRNEPRIRGRRDTERLVIGSNGDIYYTPDHYRTFVLLKGL
ncbi:hypothetical protein FOC60_02200 [Rothia dentocariosa]|nr:hypothetical protein FOC60_02200 [Rothia dentocariosa]